jgi:hypothetical protein
MHYEDIGGHGIHGIVVVEEGRGGVEAWPTAPLPFPAHQARTSGFGVLCSLMGTLIRKNSPMTSKLIRASVRAVSGTALSPGFAGVSGDWPLFARRFG